jgi:hypothetical protein
MTDIDACAADLVRRLTERGWKVQFVADPDGCGWECSKLVRVPGLGQFWRIGYAADAAGLCRWADAHEPAARPLSA